VWGWFGELGLFRDIGAVYPTGVGMVPRAHIEALLEGSLPHGCGDGSLRVSHANLLALFTPRVWGWFARAHIEALLEGVYPTGVGMVRRILSMDAEKVGLPHGCGDGSQQHVLLENLR